VNHNLPKNTPDPMTTVVEQVRLLDEAMVRVDAGDSAAAHEAVAAAEAALLALWRIRLGLERRTSGTDGG